MTPSFDTAPEADARYRRMMFEKTPSQRVMMACGLLDIARATILATAPRGSDERARRVHLFTRLYGRDFDAETFRRIVARLESSEPPSAI